MSFGTRIAVSAAVGFGIACVASLLLTWAGAYGNPEIALDVRLFQHWGREILLPRTPYVDFGIEYPPLAIATFVAPLLVLGFNATEAAYRTGYEVMLATCGIALAFVTVRTVDALGGGRRSMLLAGAFTAASPLLLGPLTLSRFELVPVLATALALWCLATRRETAAAVFLGLGTLAKLYPVLLAPFIAVHVWRRYGTRETVRWVLVLTLVLTLGFGPFMVLDAEGVVGMLTRQLERPLQVEALGAVLLLFVHALGGPPTRVGHDYDSWNLVGALPDTLATLQSVVGLVALGIVLFALARRAPTSSVLVHGLAATLVSYITFGKILSPQYVLWVLPLVAVLPAIRYASATDGGAATRSGRRRDQVSGMGAAAVILLGISMLLTSLYYPGNYAPFFQDRAIGWILVVLIRNLVLVALTAMLLAAWPGDGDDRVRHATRPD
jgi:Glycosyltransferase family 87